MGYFAPHTIREPITPPPPPLSRPVVYLTREEAQKLKSYLLSFVKRVALGYCDSGEANVIPQVIKLLTNGLDIMAYSDETGS